VEGAGVTAALRILAIDPGAKPGLAATDGRGGLAYSHQPDALPASGWDEVVHEAQHSAASLYRNGRKVRIRRSSQATLSFTAGRLFERFRGARRYRILPDDWRALLWPGARRLPKKVVLARLESQYGDLVVDVPRTNRDDVMEALGILRAWETLAEAPEEKERWRVD